MSKQYFLYGNSGGIDGVIEALSHPKTTYKTIKDALDFIAENTGFDVHELYVHWYGYDDRIKKDVYMIGVGATDNVDFLQEYGCPQFVSYMVEVDI